MVGWISKSKIGYGRIGKKRLRNGIVGWVSKE